jgi:hypothetical protein
MALPAEKDRIGISGDCCREEQPAKVDIATGSRKQQMELRIGRLGWPFRESYCSRFVRCVEQADDEDKDEDARDGSREAHSRWTYGHIVVRAFDSRLHCCEQRERARVRLPTVPGHGHATTSGLGTCDLRTSSSTAPGKTRLRTVCIQLNFQPLW